MSLPPNPEKSVDASHLAAPHSEAPLGAQGRGTDRALLEAAAKAAGIVVVRSRLDDPLNADMLIEISVEKQHG
jgi:hypothetical protein